MTGWILRTIRSEDDPAMAAIIRRVMTEFGVGPTFSADDPELDAMSCTYSRPGAAYFVVEIDGQVVGGAGVAPLQGGDADNCELRKMYLLPEARGHGIGKRLLLHCLHTATASGYRTCYLETHTGMDAARHLYEQAGFRKRCEPLGATGNRGCNLQYALELPSPHASTHRA